MTDTVTKNVNKLSAPELRQSLVASTITELGKKADPTSTLTVLEEYLWRAFGLRFERLKLTDTAAALNSVSATGEALIDGRMQALFVKVHIEKGQIGAFSGKEYANARLLANNRWPTVVPILESKDADYPILGYEAFDKGSKGQSVLFDVIEEAYATGETTELEVLLPNLGRFHEEVGKAEVESLVVEDSLEKSRTSPMQLFFGRRLDPGTRADQWFTPGRMFSLPGLIQPISWQELKSKKWIINGQEYDVTLEQVLERARGELLFEDQVDRKSYLVIAHGDDHPGNIVASTMPDSTKVFDPAAGGLAPASMANAKAFAHATILPMAGMYYDPKVQASYELRDNDLIAVNYDFRSTPAYDEQTRIAEQITRSRVVPVMQAVKQVGATTENEIKTLKSALAMCALLVVDTALLLEVADGRGTGLLPATIMLSQLRGLDFLEELNDELQAI